MSGHVVDVFACAFDQTGLFEMRYFANYTGFVVSAGELPPDSYY